jgi:hypothetical protein
MGCGAGGACCGMGGGFCGNGACEN